jgi:hypothetical protein
LLLNLRGAQQLSMDTILQPEKITASLDAIHPLWVKAFRTLYETIVGAGAGVTYYLGLWSNTPYELAAADFNALLGPPAFRDLLLPSIVQRAEVAGRAIFHLDGPDAARHYQTLLDTPAFTAIQYVVGAGNSALDKLDMLKDIQAAGRPLQVLCAFDDVLPLCDALAPDNLCILMDEVPGPTELDTLYAEFEQRYV